MSCPQIWNIKQEKVGSRPAKLNDNKGDRHLKQEKEKKQRRQFLLEEQHEHFVAAVDKMRNASGHQCKMKMSGKNERDHV